MNAKCQAQSKLMLESYLLGLLVLFYVCGFDDYVYHSHIFNYEKDFDVIVIDIPSFGFNKRYPKDKPYPAANGFNYYDNLSAIVEYMASAFDYTKSEDKYEHSYLYGHTTSGHIVINYLDYLQSKNRPIEFTKVLLCSALTRFYDTSPIKLMILVIFAIVVAFFDR